jgi:hypothetical protein
MHLFCQYSSASEKDGMALIAVFYSSGAGYFSFACKKSNQKKPPVPRSFLRVSGMAGAG